MVLSGLLLRSRGSSAVEAGMPRAGAGQGNAGRSREANLPRVRSCSASLKTEGGTVGMGVPGGGGTSAGTDRAGGGGTGAEADPSDPVPVTWRSTSGSDIEPVLDSVRRRVAGGFSGASSSPSGAKRPSGSGGGNGRLVVSMNPYSARCQF